MVRRWLWGWLLPLLLLTACDSAQAPLTIGQPVPAVQLERFAGGQLQFPDAYQGRVVLIHFWADWCALCRDELQESEPLHRRYHDQGLAVLAINMQQSRDTVADYLSRLAISYPVLLDGEGEMAQRYGVSALPLVYLLDRQGRLHTRMLGGASATQLEQIVKQLL